MEYEIVRMEAAHVPQIAALERSAFPDPWSESSVASGWTTPQPVAGGPGRGRVLGYVGSQSVMGEADMMNLAVLPAARRRGIARALVTALIRGAGRRWRAQPDPGGPGLQWAGQGAVWEHGLCPGGLPPGYYLSPKEDGEILRKEWDL